MLSHESDLAQHVCKLLTLNSLEYWRHEDAINKGIADLCVHINNTEHWYEFKLVRIKKFNPNTYLMRRIKLDSTQRAFLLKKARVGCKIGIILHIDNTILFFPPKAVWLLPSLQGKHLVKSTINLGYPMDFEKFMKAVR